MTSTAPPEDEQPTSTIAISGLVIALAILFVALRFYIRISTKAGLGWDDFLLLAAVASTILTAVLVLWASAVNPHGNWVAEAIDPSYQFVAIDVFYSKLTFVASVLYFTIAGSTKLSILFMYNRIFSVNRQFRIQLYLASFMVLGWWVGCTVATLTNCIPLRYSWINALADPRYCFNFNIYWMAAGAVEVVIDIVILSLPVRVVLGLQLSRRNKATVAMIFLLGGFVVVTGIIRTILGYHRGHYREPLYSPVEVWTMVHTSLAIVCACLPILMPLVTSITRVIGVPVQTYVYRWYSATRSRIGAKSTRRRHGSDVEELYFRGDADAELISRQSTTESQAGYRLGLRVNLMGVDQGKVLPQKGQTAVGS